MLRLLGGHMRWALASPAAHRQTQGEGWPRAHQGTHCLILHCTCKSRSPSPRFLELVSNAGRDAIEAGRGRPTAFQHAIPVRSQATAPRGVA